MNSNSCPSPEERIYLGEIVKVHGLRGDLKVLPLTWNLDRFSDLDGIWCELPGREAEYFQLKRIRLSGNMLYVKFVDLATRTLAEPWVGASIFINRADRAELPGQDYYYYDDLIGCRVECSRYGYVGTVSEVLDMPASDMWRVVGDYGEVLIPSITEFVEEIDVKNALIRVNLPEGMIDPADKIST